MRSVISLAGYVPLAIVIANCGPAPVTPPQPDDPPERGGTGSGNTGGTGMGGTVGNGGTTGGTTGGTFAAGGTGGGTGGTVATGGTTGGTVATGGAASGAAGKGGNPATGGASAGTGAGATGGTGTGGTPITGTGGAAAGAAGSGSMVDCGAAWSIASDGFVKMPVIGGCWHGYASAGGDTGSTVAPEEFNMCGMACMLSSAGEVGPATAANEYAGSIYIGFNAKQSPGSATRGTIAPTGTGLVFTFTNTGTSTTVRAQLSAGSTRWCATATSGTMIPYTSFNTACWDDSGTAYAKQAIDTVQMVIPGVEEATTFDITITSIKEM